MSAPYVCKGLVGCQCSGGGRDDSSEIFSAKSFTAELDLPDSVSTASH